MRFYLLAAALAWTLVAASPSRAADVAVAGPSSVDVSAFIRDDAIGALKLSPD